MKIFFKALLLVLFCNQLAISQLDTSALWLNEISILSNTIDIPFSDNSRNIEVLRKQEIEAINPSSVAELLQKMAGVDIRQRGINGVQSDVSIRGGTFEQVVILINGFKIIDPQTGHHLMNLPVNLEDIERIEVLKGPSSRRFGLNAFTGVINIITKAQKEQNINATLEYGSFGIFNGQLSLSQPIGDYQQTLSLGRYTSDGYRYNTDYTINNLAYQGRLKAEGSELDIFAGLTERSFGANGFYGRETFTEQYETVQTYFGGLSWIKRLDKFKINPRLSYRHNEDNWQFNSSDPEFFQNFHDTDVITLELHNSLFHNLGVLGFGVEHNWLNINSSNLSDHSRQQLSVYIENRWVGLNEKLSITPGLLLMNISDFGNKIFPGIDIGYNVNEAFSLFANVGSTTRIPTYTDLYYMDSGNIGNPDLTEENAISYEIGLKYNQGDFSIKSALFLRNTFDQIDWFRESEMDKWQPDNFNEGQFKGLEFIINYQHADENELTYGFDIDYAYIDADFEDNNFAFSRNVLENLRHQLIVAPQISYKDFQFYISGLYNDRVSLDDYFVVDANATYTFGQLSLRLKLNNITDQVYRETNLVPMPGRWFKVGLSYALR